MPKTEFARMVRHDHSMLPPTPEATIEFNSPNACNICHDDKSAEWSNQWVSKWYGNDYQKPVMKRARLLDQARKGNWENLSDILDFVSNPEEDEIYKTSFIRLLETCPDETKLPAIMKAVKDPSPLVRSAAVTGLGLHLNPQTSHTIASALQDDYRLVRIRAAASLAEIPPNYIAPSDRENLRKGLKEYEDSLKIRPDDWSFHYNLGNLYTRLERPEKALNSFKISMRLSPDNIAPRVNAAMLEARKGKNKEAEKLLREAVRIDPKNPEANYNLALLLAELQKLPEAEKHLRITLENSPNFAEAAYNLGILLAENKPYEALKWSAKAAELRPEQPRYAYTHAYYLNQIGKTTEATRILDKLIEQFPSYSAAYAFLGSIYESQGNHIEAKRVYQKAAGNPSITPADRMNFQAKIQD
jgi:tetratricopeptide (TPR) repeat protein